MEDDFGYEGRRRRRVALLERLRGLPLVATAVFTAALILLLITTVHTPVTWNDALPWDPEPSAAPVAAPAAPDVPLAHTPAPGVRPSGRASAAPSATGETGATPAVSASVLAASPSPPAPPPAQPRTTRHEAESASRSQARAVNDHRNYSGSGFVDYDNVTGAYVQWSLPTGPAGTAQLRLRFANASCCAREMEISVNGTVVARGVRFDPMASWDDWNTVTVTVTLAAGANTVRATATSREGGPNVDYLEVVQ